VSRVLVTGATGFVGRHLCNSLAALGYGVVGTTRSTVSDSASENYELRTIGDIGDDADWGAILEGVDYVVHLAARVHVMRDVERDPLAKFRRVNVRGTEQLLRSEGMRKVKRVVYVSTIKVHGDLTGVKPFSSSDSPSPSDPYAISKLEAESLVQEIGAEVGFDTTVIRPPLVYGPGVGGNFVRLLNMIGKGIPLPFALVKNSRSLVSVQNLNDLIRECLTNPSAAGERFLVSDDQDVSTPELLRVIAMAMSRQAHLLPVPSAILSFAAKLLGRSTEVSRLLGSLQVDIEATKRTLDWQPPVSMTDGIQSTVAWYQEQLTNA